MKHRVLSLSLFVTLSGAAIWSGAADEVEEHPSSKIDAALRKKFDASVGAKVLHRLNGPLPVAKRFSRVLRPVPSRYYTAEIVSTGGGAMLHFQIMHHDRSDPPAVKRKVFATGAYQVDSGEVLLWDKDKSRLVLASKHPALAGETSAG